MPGEQDIYARLDRYRDSTLAAFEDQLKVLIRRAQDSTLAEMVKRLVIEDGVIRATAANRAILDRLPDVFIEQLEELGYTRLIHAFVQEFPNQLPAMKEVLDLLSSQAKTPFPKIEFTSGDTRFLASVQKFMQDSIRDSIAQEAEIAGQAVRFGFGILPFQNLVTVIQSGFGGSWKKAQATADTAQAAFYRVALDRQYQKIESDTGQILRYRYSGPRDLRNRPFCRKAMDDSRSGKSWTKEEINAMENGLKQPKPVFLFCGGWFCRHQWTIFFA